MMGFWNVTPLELRKGDEVRVTTMGAAEFLTVLEVDPSDETTRVRFEWGSHVPLEDFWDEVSNYEKLTVRR